MHTVHGFASVLLTLRPPSALARSEAVDATALKAPFKRAGGAGKALRAINQANIYSDDLRNTIILPIAKSA